MTFLFYECSSLKSLPDISKWNTEYVNNLSYLFYKCSSLESMPDISEWNIEYVNNITSQYEDRITRLENKLK